MAVKSGPEHRRLDEAPTGAAVAALGPVPRRAPMGHGTRGLQRQRRRLAYFTHDQARSRAYRWGEDGLAGICDDASACASRSPSGTAHDPILKERLFGLTNREGNHGEDVKEYYFYLDSTPTHSYCATCTSTPRRPSPTTTWWPRAPDAAGRTSSTS